MKVYFYDIETGIYQGTSYEADRTAPRKGMTTVAPPPYGKGEVPIYSAELQNWSIKLISRLPNIQS